MIVNRCKKYLVQWLVETCHPHHENLLIYPIFFLIKKIVPQISTSNYWDSEQDDGGAVINSIYPAQILDELRNGQTQKMEINL